jgi:hypothetical protein
MTKEKLGLSGVLDLLFVGTEMSMMSQTSGNHKEFKSTTTGQSLLVEVINQRKIQMLNNYVLAVILLAITQTQLIMLP